MATHLIAMIIGEMVNIWNNVVHSRQRVEASVIGITNAYFLCVRVRL